MKNILILNGHPFEESLNNALADAYQQGASTGKVLIERIDIGKLKFDYNLRYGYTKRMDLEPDLQDSLQKIQNADHLVWIHPVWWGGFPAIMKGFIDRLFLPGIAYKYRENSIWWDKLLAGKTAHIITTIDQPAWYYRLFYGHPSVNQLKKSILGFCGIKPVKVSYVGVVRQSDANQRQKWIDRIYKMGRDQV